MAKQNFIIIDKLKRIRFIVKEKFDRIPNEKLKKNLLSAIPFWIGSLIVGIVSVFYARLFSLAEKLSDKIISYNPWLLFALLPVCFVLAWWIVKKWAPYAKGSGIPQVMAAIEISTPRDYEKVKYLLSFKIIVVKVISSFVLVLGGGAIGREGPTIQISGSIFNKINNFLPSWWPKISKKNMILTGAAAGLSAAFNTPLGGIVFAVEELTKIHFNYFRTAIFTAVIIAGLTAQELAGSYLYLGYPKVTGISVHIILGVIVVAIIASFAAAILCKIILAIQKWKNGFKSDINHVLFLTGSALLIATAAFFIHRGILGSGKALMEGYLFNNDKYAPWYVPLLRMSGTALSFTSGGAGGIFAPALSGGASVGSVISGWLHLSNSNTNVMILAGMVAFLTGVTRAPFTSAILVLEMTDRHSLIMHLMIAAMIANFVAMTIMRHSLYDYLKHDYLHEVIHHAAESPSDNTKEALTV